MNSTIETRALTIFSGMPFIGDHISYPYGGNNTKLTIYTELSVGRVNEREGGEHDLVVLMGDQIDPTVNRGLNPNLKKTEITCIVVARSATEFSGHISKLTARIDDVRYKVDLGGLQRFTIRTEPNGERPTLFRLIGG